jgi:ATP adenylyltransferase
MDLLWAGWRSAYVRSVDDEATSCLFCGLPDASDEDGLILERGEHAFSLLNRYPYTTGHLMVSQYRHVADPGDLSSAERLDVWELLERGRTAILATMAPRGFNLGANLGRVAGAGIPDHLHFHLVPRWSGDTNFMTSVAATRVLPEDLADTRDRLRRVLD